MWKRKFYDKSFKCKLVGYGQNGYKLWDIRSKKFVVARHVVVDEINKENTRTVVNDSESNIPIGSTDGKSDNLGLDKQPSETTTCKKADPILIISNELPGMQSRWS